MRKWKLKFLIFNALGLEVFGDSRNFSLGKNEFNITIPDFPKGVYYVKVAGGVGVRKMVRM